MSASDVEGEEVAAIADVRAAVGHLELALGLRGGAGEFTRVQLPAPLEEATGCPARASRDAVIAPP